MNIHLDTKSEAMRNIRLEYAKSNSLLKQVKEQKWLLMFVSPAILLTFTFSYLPMFGNIIAFQDFDIVKGFLSSPFVGLKHFKEIFNDPHALMAIKNTLILSSVNLVFTFPAPIILALLFNELKTMWVKRTVQTISYLPHFISWVIIAGLVKQLTALDGGTINEIKVALFGGEPVMFLAKSELFLPIIVITNIWKEVGWNTIIFLAALSSVDPQLYESAAIDGAGRLKQAIHITIPGILPTIIILLILNLGHLFGTNFDQVYNLINVHIQDKVDVLETYVFREGIQRARYPFATAVGLFQAAISFVLIAVTNKLAKKLTEISIW